jgi:hypothetical protein
MIYIYIQGITDVLSHTARVGKTFIQNKEKRYMYVKRNDTCKDCKGETDVVLKTNHVRQLLVKSALNVIESA